MIRVIFTRDQCVTGSFECRRGSVTFESLFSAGTAAADLEGGRLLAVVALLKFFVDRGEESARIPGE